MIRLHLKHCIQFWTPYSQVVQKEGFQNCSWSSHALQWEAEELGLLTLRMLRINVTAARNCYEEQLQRWWNWTLFTRGRQYQKGTTVTNCALGSFKLNTGKNRIKPMLFAKRLLEHWRTATSVVRKPLCLRGCQGLARWSHSWWDLTFPTAPFWVGERTADLQTSPLTNTFKTL